MGLAVNSMLLSLTMGMLSLNKGYNFYNKTFMLHIKRKIKVMRGQEDFDRELLKKKRAILDSALQKIKNDLAFVPEKEVKND